MTLTQRKTNSWVVEHGDALRVLSAMVRPEPFGAVITDPPYSSVGSASQATAKRWFASQQVEAPDYDGDNKDARSWILWSSIWLSECRRLTREGGLLCVLSDWRMVPALSDAIQMAGWVWSGIAPWDKGRGTRPRRGAFRSQCEYILWASNGLLATDTGVHLDGLFHHPRRKAEKRWHQQAKPEALAEELVRVAPVGSDILDPFCGGATFGVAALRAGCGFVGIESQGDCHRLAVQRLELESEQRVAV